jgi:hypothetical protein
MRDEPGTGRIAALSGPAWGCRALKADLPGPDGPLPLLILDVRPEMAVRSGLDERVNLLVTALLSMGLTLVTTISEQLAEAMDGEARALAGRDRPVPPPW